jgi:hypothetical protein
MKTLLFTLTTVLLSCLSPAWAQPTIKQQQIQFDKGKTGATLKGHLKGDETIDYMLRANAGQVLAVKFKPSNPSAYFNVMAPGADSAIFIGSTSGNEFSAALEAGGEYTIRVYLMRNAARRGEAVNYTLEVGVTGKATQPAASAAPAATSVAPNAAAASGAGPAKWDASGSVKCSAGSDTFDQMCGFRVVRDLPRKAADVWIGNAATGQSNYRYLHYADKVFTTNDKSKLAWQRKDDNWWVSVNGREFYFIPDALIHGG